VRDGLLSEIGGRSLADVVEGREMLTSRPALSSLRRSGYWASVRTPGFKYLVNRVEGEETELLYDLQSDPREHRPLRPDVETLDPETQAILADLRSALIEKESTAFAARVEEGAEDMELPARVREELRSLGYIQ
jgi:hypothetical protein